jgi:hypothetical protein
MNKTVKRPLSTRCQAELLVQSRTLRDIRPPQWEKMQHEPPACRRAGKRNPEDCDTDPFVRLDEFCELL